MSIPAFLSVAEYAGVMRVSEATVRKLIREAALPAERLGPRLFRIPTAGLPDVVRAALASEAFPDTAA